MEYKFSQLFEWRSGKPISATEGNIPIYGSNGIIGYTSTPKFKNKLILGRVGAYCGSVAYCPGDFNATDNTLITTCNESKIIYPYAYYLLKQYKLNDFAGGSAQPLITQGLLKHLKCDIPDIAKQQHIAGILSKYDVAIENNNKRIKVLEQMAESLYKEWFVRFRFPGYENAEFENGIPKGWQCLKLDKVLTVFYGKDHSKVGDGDVPIYGSGGLMRYGNQALYVGESVLIPRKGSLNNIMWVNQPFWTVDTMFYTKALIPHIEKYVYYVLSATDMAAYNTGAALPSMTTDILYHLKIVVPSAPLLAKFDEVVSKLYEQRSKLQRKNENLTKQRDMLLPRLMSGKLEV